MPLLAGSHQNIAMKFGMKKTRPPDVENNGGDTITRFGRIHECGVRTDKDVQTPHDDIGRACIASCGKHNQLRSKLYSNTQF